MSFISKKLRELKDYRSISDPKIKEQVIIDYAPLVRFIAQKIVSRLPTSIELDDLISCGVIGLMDAIDKFNPDRDNKFKTYAEFRIRGAILDELRAQDFVPRSVREKAKMVERTYAKLEAQLNRSPTDEEMCEELNLNYDEFNDLLRKIKSVVLLNIDDLANFNRYHKKISDGESDLSLSNPFHVVSSKSYREKIKQTIEALPEKHRLVLSLYYYEDLNLKEIGQVLSVTESRVSQLHTQAILYLKGKLRAYFDQNEKT